VRVTRRGVLGGLLASGATPLLADAPLTSIRPAPRAADLFKRAVISAQALVEQARLGGEVGFAVADMRTGTILESRAPALGLAPASTAKTMTSLYALDALGIDHRFETRLVATGPVTAGRLEGDLILAGGGDPTLDTDALADMAMQLKQVGLREISGRFLVADGALPLLRDIDADQPDHVGYNPAVGGLNLNFNRVHFEWRREAGKYRVTMDARSDRYRPEVTMAQMRVIDRTLPVYTYADDDGRDAWTVARGALGTGGARWLPVRRPALYAGEVFQTFARAQGIALNGDVGRTDSFAGTTLVRHNSAALPEILRDMLRYSTNLTAEVVGMTASVRRGGPVSGLAESAARMNAWLADRGLAPGAAFVDHSGLSGTSRMSAGDMAQAMVAAGQGGILRGLLRTYPMENRPETPVQAKTGTLNFVSALTGFVASPGNTDLAFAIFCADSPRRAAVPLTDRESPPGGAAWTRRARTLQWALLERWSTLYTA